MAATFDGRSSTSAPRSALPSVDFGFDDLRTRMTQFTTKFDTFIGDGRRTMLEERNRFRLDVADLEESHKLKQRDIEILGQKSNTHAQNVAKEDAETNEANIALANITAQRNEREALRDKLREEITATEKIIAQRVEAQKVHADKMGAQARFNDPELDFWTNFLCLRIEGAGMIDRLKFIFTHVDERNWEKEAWFELDTAERDYSVKTTNPKIEVELMGACVDQLNETRDLGKFLQSVRKLFVEALKNA